MTSSYPLPALRRDLEPPVPAKPLVVNDDRHANQNAAGGLSRQLVLNALRRWWKLVVPIGALLAVAAVAVVLLLFQPVYRATAWLRIASRPPYVVFQESENEQETARYIATQLQLVKSPMVLMPVVSKPEVAGITQVREEPDSVSWLADHLEMERIGNSELFRLSFKCTDPAAAVTLVNAVTNTYLAFRTKSDNETRNRIVRSLEEENGKQLEQIKRLRANLRELTAQNSKNSTLGSSNSRSGLAPPFLAELWSRMVDLELAELEQYSPSATPAETAGSSGLGDRPEAKMEAHIMSDLMVQRLRTELADTNAKLDLIVRESKHPETRFEYRDLKRLADQQGNRLAARIAELSQAAPKRLNLQNPLARRAAELQEVEQKTQRIAAQKKFLEARVRQEMARIQQEGTDNLELDFAKGELDLAEKTEDLISTRLTRLLIEGQSIDRVQLFREGEIETVPVRSFPAKECILATMTGLLLPFAIAVMWEQLVRKVSDTQTLEQQVAISVLGEVTRLPTYGENNANGCKRLELETKMYHESLDSIATVLRLSDQLKLVRILAITSAVPHEGKTSLATELAISIARTTKSPTLLIDGDMRAPDVHRIMGVPLTPGLCEVLEGTAELTDTIVPALEDHLDVVPAGRMTASPLALLREAAAASLFSQIDANYRYVIIDSPPVLSASESLVLGKAADAVLLCAMRDVSRENQVRDAQRRLRLAGARPIGVVLNGVPSKSYLSRYGYYAHNDA